MTVTVFSPVVITITLLRGVHRTTSDVLKIRFLINSTVCKSCEQADEPMKLRHQIQINITEKSGNKQEVLQSEHRSLPKRLVKYESVCSNVWRYITRVESRLDSCDADTIQESELQETVIKAINSILAQKSTAIGVLQENIEEVLKQENSPTKDVDGKLEELQKQLLQRANKNEKYDDLVEEVYKLREEKQRILADKAELEGVKQSIFNMKAFLNSQTAKIEEYDEQLVRRLIAKVTVYDERFEVELKSGISVDIQRNK